MPKSNKSKNVATLASKKNARKNVETKTVTETPVQETKIAETKVETTPVVLTPVATTTTVEQKPKCYTVTHANGAALSNMRPGVLAHIERMLREATAQAPVDKKTILASLVVAFPDREESKMKTTVAMQVPSGFKIEKGYIIGTVAGGYYFDAEKTAEYQATHEKRGGKWVAKVV